VSGNCTALQITLANINNLDGPFCGALSKLPQVPQVQAITRVAITDVNEKLAVTDPKVTAYPNPFNSVVNFRIVSPESGQANLELYDMVGRRLAVVYTGRIDANSPRTITYKLPVVHQSLIVYKFTINGKTVVGNLISSDGNSINKP
jgi:hypothetical protein